MISGLFVTKSQHRLSGPVSMKENEAGNYNIIFCFLTVKQEVLTIYLID